MMRYTSPRMRIRRAAVRVYETPAGEVKRLGETVRAIVAAQPVRLETPAAAGGK